MKARPMKECQDEKGRTVYRPCEPAEATHVSLNFPGPYPFRLIPVAIGRPAGNAPPEWTWNLDTEKPTLSPSILTWTGDRQSPTRRCHSFVRDGMVQFLGDCTHELAGQTVPLLDIERD